MLKILDTKDTVHAAFCNNFDTVGAVTVRALRAFVRHTTPQHTI